MKNFKRNLSIFISIFFIAVIIGTVGAALLAASIKQEPHNMAVIWTSIIMLSLGCGVMIPTAGMIYSTIYQNNEAKQEAIKVAHEEEILPFAKAYLKGKYGYDDTNSKIYCKDGKVYCKPITDITEITVEITIE
jgi:hypothetical protein